jgi:hypothetical protein
VCPAERLRKHQTAKDRSRRRQSNCRFNAVSFTYESKCRLLTTDPDARLTLPISSAAYRVLRALRSVGVFSEDGPASGKGARKRQTVAGTHPPTRNDNRRDNRRLLILVIRRYSRRGSGDAVSL